MEPTVWGLGLDLGFTPRWYREALAIPNVGYVDMGLESDLPRARKLFPGARRAVMYTPMDLARKPDEEIHADFARIARDYAPCDIVLADIEAGTPDGRVLFALDICRRLSGENVE